MTEELEVYISILEDKDKNNERYFLNVLGEKDSQSGVMQFPLLSMKQLRNKATGSERFKNCVSQAIQKGIKSIIVEEYSNCSDTATPISVNTFELSQTPKAKGKGKNKTKNNVMNDSKTLSSLNEIFNAMGIDGGLNGFMKATAQGMSIADRYEDAKETIADLKSEVKDRDSEIKSLKKDMEKLRQDLRDQKDKTRDIQHDSERKIADIQQQYGLLGTLGNFAGAFMANTSVGQKFAGFLAGTPTPPPPAAQAPQPTSQGPDGIVELDPMVAQALSNIDDYVKSLDFSDLESFSAIVEYCANGIDNLKRLESVAKKLYYKQTQQQNGGIPENLDD